MVDFGPWMAAEYAFLRQAQHNPPGKSPPLCSEF